MSLWSWVRALTEAKEKGMGHAPIACEWTTPRRSGPGGGTLTKQCAFFCKGPTPGPLRRGVVPPQAIGACSMPFSFASVRARTQDQRDILKWRALSLPTGLVAQLVVRVLPILICPFGLGFELSRRRKKRARDMPL